MKKPGYWVLAGSLILNLVFVAAWLHQRQPRTAGLDFAEFTTTESGGNGHFRIRFATSMDIKDEDLPVRLSPALPVRHIWEDDRELILLPDSSPMPGLPIAVPPREDATDAAGQPLRSSQLTTYSAPLHIELARHERLAPKRYRLHFEANADIPPASLLPHLKVSGASLSLGENKGIIAEFAETPESFSLRIAKTLRAPGADRGLRSPVEAKVSIESEGKLVRNVYSVGDRDGFELRLRMADPVSLAEAREHITVEPAVDFEIRRRWSSNYALVGDFQPRQFYRITLAAGMRFSEGRVLEEEQVRTLATRDLDPVLNFASRGPVLPLSRSDSLPIEVANIERVGITARQIFPNNLVEFFRDGDSDDAGRRVGSDAIDLDLSPNVVHDSTLPLDSILGGNGPGIYEVTLVRSDRYWPRSTRTIVRTDLGLSISWGSKGLAATVLSLGSNAPIADCAIKVFSRQNQLLGSGATGANGLARIRLEDGGAPYLIVAEHGNDQTFLGLGDSHQHDLTAFKMPARAYASGAYEAFVYSERGVCRPGESITLNLLLRDRAAKAVGDFPVEIRVRDPENQIMHQQTLTLDGHGFASLELPLAAQARTGSYSVEAGEPDGQIWGSNHFKVAHYQPDRIRTELVLDQDSYEPDSALIASVAADYYFGRPVTNSQATIQLDFAAASVEPEGFADFAFTPAADDLDLPSRQRERASTDVLGKVTQTFQLPESSPGGALKLLLRASVQEPGGRAVSAAESAVLYAWPFYLGLRPNWDESASPEGPLELAWVAVSAKGEPRHAHALRYTLQREEWQYTLSEDGRGDLAYRWEKELVTVAEGDLDRAGHKGAFEIDPGSPGHYVVELHDKEVGVNVRHSFSLWYGDGGGARPSHPATLVIHSDRERYAPGDTARLTFQSPTTGVAMITSGAGEIDRSFAIEVQPGENVVEIPLPGIAQGCAYVGVTIIGPDGVAELPRRLFGLARLSLDQAGRKLAVQLELPDEARPGQTIEVGVETGAKAQVQLMLVDEGILALTKFDSPSPFWFFHGERRCGLRFGDVYDLLFPETPEHFGQIAAIGGGGSAARYLNIAADMQKPAVVVLPPREIDGAGKIPVTLPDHTGALRVMAVAFNNVAVGSGHQELRVRDDLSLLMSAPQVVAPGDRFELTAQISNHRADRKQAISVSIDGPVTTIEAPPEVVYLSPGESTTVVARFEAAESAGAVGISLQVGDQLETSRLVVRPPSPPISRAEFREIPAGQRMSFEPEGEWLAGTAQRQLSISANPAIDASNALAWLRLYPYGCLEQSVSNAFPLAYADGINSAFDAKARQQPVAATLDRLRLMQTSRGGFAMWPGGDTPWFGASVYAAHFLVATKQQGSVLDRALDYLARTARRSDKSVEDRGYALYVLAAGGKPQHALAESLLADSANSGLSRFLAAASLVRGGRAREGAEALEKVFAEDYLAGKLTWYMDSPARRAGLALTVLQDIIPDSPEVPELLAMLRRHRTADGHWGTTQANAMAALAIGQWGRLHPEAGHGKGIARIGDAEFAIGELERTLGNEAVVIDADPSGPLYASLLTRGVPLKPDTAEFANGMSITRSYTDADGHSVAEFAQGDLVTVTIRLASSQARKDVVVVDLLPGGLQIEDGGLATRWQHADEAKGVAVNFVEKLDDRLLLYCDLLGHTEAIFRYQTRAVTRGRFVIPRITAEAMYAPEVAAASGNLSPILVY